MKEKFLIRFRNNEVDFTYEEGDFTWRGFHRRLSVTANYCQILPFQRQHHFKSILSVQKNPSLLKRLCRCSQKLKSFAFTWSPGGCCCWAPSCCGAVPGLCLSSCLPPGCPGQSDTGSAWSSSVGWLERRAQGGHTCRSEVGEEAEAAGGTWTDRLDCWAALHKDSKGGERGGGINTDLLGTRCHKFEIKVTRALTVLVLHWLKDIIHLETMPVLCLHFQPALIHFQLPYK